MKAATYLFMVIIIMMTISAKSSTTDNNVFTLPREWVKLGAPETYIIGKFEPKKWFNYYDKYDERVKAKTLSAADAALVKKFVEFGINNNDLESLGVFVVNMEDFKGTPWQNEFISLNQTLLLHSFEPFRALAANNLAKYGSKESLPLILPLLTNVHDVRSLALVKKSIRKLGYELPFEDDLPLVKQN